jgi:hypothetical protein
MSYSPGLDGSRIPDVSPKAESPRAPRAWEPYLAAALLLIAGVAYYGRYFDYGFIVGDEGSLLVFSQRLLEGETPYTELRLGYAAGCARASARILRSTTASSSGGRPGRHLQCLGCKPCAPYLRKRCQLVVGRPGYPGLPARRRDVAKLFGSAEETQTKSVYPVFEGHRGIPFVPVSQQERRRNASLTLLTVCSGGSRPLRHSSS